MRPVIKQGALLQAALVLLFAALGHAGVPAVNQVTVTDVTPVSFSVVWTASEPSTGSVDVFCDSAGTCSVSGITLVAQPVQGASPSIGQSAEDLGVLKVRVSGLDPDTIYYFRTVTTSKSTSQTTYSPAVAPLRRVTTESAVLRTKFLGDLQVPFTNTPLWVDCHLPGGTQPAPTGSLVVVAVDGANYPVSAFVGDGAPPGKAWIDLNNLFSSKDFLTLEVYGGESMMITSLLGAGGMDTETLYIPVSRQTGEVKAALQRSPCWADLTGDGSVNVADLAAFAARFGRADCVPGHWCEGDFERDRDVDGLNLVLFATEVGRTDCP